MTWEYRDTIPGIPTGGGGPNPVDDFRLGIKIADNNVVPTDAMSVAFAFPDAIASAADAAALALIFADTNAALSDTLANLAIRIADNIAGQTETIALGVSISDSVSAQTDATQIAMVIADNNAAITDVLLRLAISLSTDTNLSPTDLAEYELEFLQNDTVAEAVDAMATRIAGIGDTNSAPTDARTSKTYFWLSGSTGTSGNTVTPANANGPNDGLVATARTVTLGASTATITSNVGNGVPNGTSLANGAIYRGWFGDDSASAVSVHKMILRSSSALFTDIVVWQNPVSGSIPSGADHLNGDFTVDLIAAGINTLAKLQSLQVLLTSTDTIAGVGGTVRQDAGRIELTNII